LRFFNKGITFPYVVVESVNRTVDGVIFPVMAGVQKDNDAATRLLRRSIQMSSFIIMPMMVGLAVCAEPLVRLVLTEKWLPCVPFLRISCLVYAFYPILTANSNTLKALGYGKQYFRVELIKKVIGLALMAATMFISVYAIALIQILETLLSQIVSVIPIRKTLNYGYGRQLRDILPQILLSLAMGAAVYAVTFADISDLLMLAIQIPLGFAIYLLGSLIFRIDSFTYLVGILREKRHGESST